MTRVHDMGGRYGDGKINPDLGKEDVFKAKWHARALAVTLASGSLKKWNLDMSRHARECLPPKEYATFSYFCFLIFVFAGPVPTGAESSA